jgi:hypothetical protein
LNRARYLKPVLLIEGNGPGPEDSISASFLWKSYVIRACRTRMIANRPFECGDCVRLNLLGRIAL